MLEEQRARKDQGTSKRDRDGKLGQICTNFEVKRRKSAALMGIGGSPSGHAAPEAAFSLEVLEIGSLQHS